MCQKWDDVAAGDKKVEKARKLYKFLNVGDLNLPYEGTQVDLNRVMSVEDFLHAKLV